MIVMPLLLLGSTEKSQAHESKVCSLHCLATSLAIPALMMALRKAVSRVPVDADISIDYSYSQLRTYTSFNKSSKVWTRVEHATIPRPVLKLFLALIESS